VNVDSAGTQANNYTLPDTATISADGRFVAFVSDASNLVAGGNAFDNVYVHDLHTGSTTILSIDPSGSNANLNSSQAAISASGRFVAFQSTASNLIQGDNSGAADVFV